MSSSPPPSRPRRGVFPGSFNPLTVAHLEVAHRAKDAHGLDEVHLVVSRVALDKPQPPGPSFDQRLALLEADAAEIDWLFVSTTEHQLIVDIAEGFDVVIMGADKWIQVNDRRYYDSPAARDAALERLPEVVVAERAGSPVGDVPVMSTSAAMKTVSSSKARDGARHLMAPVAAAGWRHRPAIRRCRADELNAAASIYIDSRRANVPSIPPSIHPEHDMRRWFAEVLANSADIWVAETEGALTGLLALEPGWVEQLYIRPGHEGCGIGSSLIRHAQAVQQTLDLWTFQSNDGAQRFYERHGFVEIERTNGDNEEREPDIRYRWTRDGSS